LTHVSEDSDEEEMDQSGDLDESRRVSEAGDNFRIPRRETGREIEKKKKGGGVPLCNRVFAALNCFPFWGNINK
jgi:hypothetical protein